MTYSPRKNLNTVSIVAMGPSGSDYLRDYHVGGRKSGEVWGINYAGLWYPGIDLIFAMDDMKRDLQIDRKYVVALRKSGLPIMTCTSHYENCIAYPIEGVVRDVYGASSSLAASRRFRLSPPLENTVTFAIAYAIYRKAKEIRFYGCDFYLRDSPEIMVRARKRWQDRLSNPPDWFAYHDYQVVDHRRPREPGAISTAYMAGLAAGRGIELWVSPNSVFLDNDREWTVHGYDDFGAIA